MSFSASAQDNRNTPHAKKTLEIFKTIVEVNTSKAGGGNYEKVQDINPDAANRLEVYQQKKRVNLIPASLKPVKPGQNLYKFTKSKGF